MYRYCHCDRIKDVFKKEGKRIRPAHCSRGGGFYRYNWERIVGAPVRVELRTTIMRDDADRSFVLHLPVEIR
ncbi:MAG: hypothetical protein WC375_07055 [Methanomassiliicoccales archaeon]|jgi:hypothetical protein